MAVNCLLASALSTLISFVGLQWWTAVSLDRIKSDGLMDETGIHSSNAAHILELLLVSPVTITLLVTFLLNVFVLVILCLKTIFFVQLYPSETRKVLERVINYVIYKGTFLPLVVPPNVYQVAIWSTWMIVLCSLKMFQTLARDRLERLNASPSATPWTYFRVFSALLLVLSADLFWIRLCMIVCKALGSSMFVLLFFEPLSIAFETLQAIMVHGFQLLEMWQRHSVDDSTDCVGPSNKSTAGSIWELKGNLMRNFGFLLEMMTLLMALGHYLTIWWLHGMAFHLVDAVLFLNLRALVTAVIKRMKGYIKLRKALSSLNGALPDATYDELGAYDDECAICREPMAKAKRLSCNHLFHLPCLRSWLDQGLNEVYSCPTCRRPLFPSNSGDYTVSRAGEVSNVERNVTQVNLGSDQQRVSDVLPIEEPRNQQLNPSYGVWREPGLGMNWVTPRPNPGMDGAGTSAIRPVGLGRVQMMMRHLASVGETYTHGALEDSSWNLWSAQLASSSSVPPPSSSLRDNRNGGGALRVRNASPSGNGNLSDILAMTERVREILPHIPDELIIEDLRRTNNPTVTVNNFLPTS